MAKLKILRFVLLACPNKFISKKNRMKPANIKLPYLIANFCMGDYFFKGIKRINNNLMHSLLYYDYINGTGLMKRCSKKRKNKEE
jgi:hypothetical protein